MPVTPVSTWVSASDAPPSDDDNCESAVSTHGDIGVGTERKSSSDSAVQVRSSPAQPETVHDGTQADIGGTERKSSGDSADRMRGSSAHPETSNGGTQAGIGNTAAVVSPGEIPSGLGGESGIIDDNSHESDEDDRPRVVLDSESVPSVDVVVPHSAVAAPASGPSYEGSSGSSDTREARGESGESVDQNQSVDITAKVERRGENACTEKAEEIESSAGGFQREGGIVAPHAAGTNREKDASDGPKNLDHTKIAGLSDDEGGAREGRDGEVAEQGQQSQQRRSEDGGDGGGLGSSTASAEHRSRCSPVASPVTIATGRDRYESIDGETLLGKLLDESAPSTAFEDNHQQLLNKLMRVRDDDKAGGVNGSGKSPSHPCSRLTTLFVETERYRKYMSLWTVLSRCILTKERRGW